MSDQPKKTTVCPACESEDDWGGASWCPSCGYYPAINRQVESGPDLEEEQVYDHWWQVIPGWVWTMGAACTALLVMSIAVRLMFAESIIRTWWTIGQMGLGIVAALVAHFLAYLYAVGKSDKLGPLDMFMRPVATWQPVFRGLPGSSNLVCALGCGVVAIALGYFVIDGVDYLAIMKADAEARKQAQAEQAAKDAKEGKKKMSAMGMMLGTASVMAQANQNATGEAPPESLEDALNSFAGEAGVNELAAGGGPGGIGGALNEISGEGGVDVDAYMEQQRAIANGEVPPGGEGASAEGSVPQNLSNVDINAEAGDDSTTDGEEESEDGSPTVKTIAPQSSTGRGGETSPVSTERNPNGGRPSSLPANRDEVECLVLGYTTNASGEIRSVLLAAAPERRHLRFVGKIGVDQVDPAVLKTMLKRFDEIPARRSIVRSPFGGRWVRPEVFCMVQYSGWNADGRLHEAYIARLVSGH